MSANDSLDSTDSTRLTTPHSSTLQKGTVGSLARYQSNKSNVAAVEPRDWKMRSDAKIRSHASWMMIQTVSIMTTANEIIQ